MSFIYDVSGVDPNLAITGLLGRYVEIFFLLHFVLSFLKDNIILPEHTVGPVAQSV